MNAFKDASLVEARGMKILLPFLDEQAGRGLVLTSKGSLARRLQLVAGDVLYNDKNDRLWAVEIKCEEENKFGNLFLETWSNRNLEDKANHSYHGSNQGWLHHCRADLLLYYFLDSDELYIIDLFSLKRWAFGCANTPGRIYGFDEKPQAKRAQRNDTWGRCVPIAVLNRELGTKIKKVNPIGLLVEGMEAAA